MAFQSSDGSKFTNHSTMKQHEARGPKKPAGEAQQEVNAEEGQPNDGQAMASQHGPAIELNINHGEGGHSVHAVHPDGHSHETQHGSADEAHKYAADCAGVGMQ